MLLQGVQLGREGVLSPAPPNYEHKHVMVKGDASPFNVYLKAFQLLDIRFKRKGGIFDESLQYP